MQTFKFTMQNINGTSVCADIFIKSPDYVPTDERDKLLNILKNARKNTPEPENILDIVNSALDKFEAATGRHLTVTCEPYDYTFTF